MTAVSIGNAAAFQFDAGSFWMDRLFGLACNNDQAPVRARGLAAVSTSAGRFEAGSLNLCEHQVSADGARLVWQMGEGAMRLESRWQLSADTGVLSRKDRLTNTASAPVTVYRCLPRFAFAPARYEVYAQNSRWSNENQGAWASLHTGSLSLGSEWGRSSEGCTPYACLREAGGACGVVFHVIPHGNWIIRFSTRMGGNRLPYVVVELGLCDDDLRLVLAPGEARDLPEILVQDLPGGDPCKAAPPLHRYLNARLKPFDKPDLPVIYNTWMDRMSRLDLARLREQVRAARDLGCEAFVVDAGWFGPDDGVWAQAVGIWQEKMKSAFCGGMQAFADEVRAAGMGFGLWMEPERMVENAPIRQQHPEWFFPGQPRFNLEIPAAREYLYSEMARLIETYGVAWFKLDYNVSLGYDATGAELCRYYDAWYGIMDALRRKYPGTVFENCSSGAMRHDLSTLFHYDTQFISDSANPLDMIRIAEGAMLRMPPGRIMRWAVLRGIGRTLPELGKKPGEGPERIVAPCGATWQIVESLDVDFLMAVALPGALGFSGDLRELSEETRARLRWHVAFFKQWRRFLQTASAYPLTPVKAIGERAGWTAFQLQSPASETSLLLAYHLPNDGVERRAFRLSGLRPAARYTIRKVGPDGVTETAEAGAVLMQQGLAVTEPFQEHARWNAHLFVVEPAAAPMQ